MRAAAERGCIFGVVGPSGVQLESGTGSAVSADLHDREIFTGSLSMAHFSSLMTI